jgi:AAA+ ATPase superfamily predicted ATPase
VKENIRQKILMPGSFLNEEPLALLRMEVRDTNMYNSILQTIASGTNRSSEIASSIHEEQSKVNKYMQTLLTLRLISKIVPCAEKNESKKAFIKSLIISSTSGTVTNLPTVIIIILLEMKQLQMKSLTISMTTRD